MKTDIRKQAAINPFKKDNTSDWKDLAQKQFEENEELKNKIVALENIGLAESQKDIIEINPIKCRNWKYSDRNTFELGDLEELSEDIKKNGQLQPAILRKLNDEKFEYEIIAGERRWRACKLANIPLKAVITDKDDTGCIVIQTSENKKKSLSFYSLAKVYFRLMEDKGVSQNKMAEILGIPSTSFREILSFNKVPESVWQAVSDISLVKPRTASYIARQCEKGEEYSNAFILLAEKIRQGIGVDSLDKLIQKHFSNKRTNRNETKVFHGSDGKVLFRVTSEGRLTFPKHIIERLDLEKLSESIKELID